MNTPQRCTCICTHIKKYFHLALLISLPATLFAQSQQWRNYSAKDGLPSSVVYDMLQDSSGYLWFAGDMGVSRFDGYSFTNFSTRDGLASNSIVLVKEDNKKRIWFISFSGEISYYQRGKIHNLPCNKVIEESLNRSDRICSFYVDNSDNIWYGTLYSGVTKITSPWKEDNIKKTAIHTDGIYVYNVDDTGSVFGSLYGTSEARFNLSVYEKGKLQFVVPVGYSEKQFPLNKKPPGRVHAQRLPENKYLFCINNHVYSINKTGVLETRIEKNLVLNASALGDEMWYGTYSGVSIRSAKNPATEKRIKILENKSITAIHRDHENGIWVSTDGLGVYYLPYENFVYYTQADGLSDSKITTAEKMDSEIVLGHLNGTLSLPSESGIKSIALDPGLEVPGVLNAVNTMVHYRLNEWLIGTFSTLYSINMSSKVVSKFLTMSPTKKLHMAANGNLWMVQYSEIKQLDEKQNVTEQIVINSYTDNVFEDSKGTLWICSMNGLWTYSNGTMEKCGVDNPVLFSRPVDVDEDKNGNIWIAIRGNGVMIKTRKGYIHITEKDGLASDMCATLYIDSLNTVWVGTNRGMSKIQLETNGKYKIQSFTSANGLLSNEVNHIIERNNRLWLIHNNEISIVAPQLVISNTTPPPVYISNVRINHKTLTVQKHTEFAYNQNHLEIQYVGLSYKTAGALSYKYKMEGLDKDWNHTTYTSVRYQTLPPGEYKFVVYAQNNDGIWSKNPAEFSFRIRAAWWQTAWFIWLSVIVFLLCVSLLFRVRLNRLRKREQEKTHIQHRLQTTELSALRAQMNPHFVFNVINSVQFFIATNDSVSSQKYLSKFAKLIRYVLDNSRPATIPLQQELDALTLYMELEALRFENRFEFSFNIEATIDTKTVEIPSMLIQPYIENAIWHGIMHKEGKGIISISLHKKNNDLICVVEDNGIGRKKANMLKEENMATYKSVGMSITAERLDIINKMNNSLLRVNVVDLLNTQGEGNGTRVELTIPLHEPL